MRLVAQQKAQARALHLFPQQATGPQPISSQHTRLGWGHSAARAEVVGWALRFFVAFFAAEKAYRGIG